MRRRSQKFAMAKSQRRTGGETFNLLRPLASGEGQLALSNHASTAIL